MTARDIHMIGESHCLSFRDVTTEAFTCHAQFFSAIQATDYMVGNTLNPIMIAMLTNAGVFAAKPPVVFFVSDMDLHQMFALLGDKYDFLLPDDPGYGADKNKHMIPYETVCDTISAFLAVFFKAAAILRTMGLTPQAVHCLPPRTLDDAAAAEWSGNTPVSATVRSKLTVLTNRLLAAECAKTGMGFIDIWADVSDGLYMKAGYNLDAVHLNRKAVPLSLAKIEAYFNHAA